LCSEIVQYYNENEYAVCNLASICLPKFVIKKEDNTYDFNFNELLKVAKILTTNLNNIIDINFYPVEETKTSNFKMRPIGVGVQGLTDCYQMMKLPYNSEKARTLNKQIFETIYYGCLSRSCELAKEKKPYDKFDGSPYSQGKFQFHMWGLTEDDMTSPIIGKEKWLQLKEDVMKYGTISSLHTCVMPTASTSQIQGNTESTEVKTSNLYMRKTISGEFIVINEYLVKHLEELGLWNDQIRNEIIYDQGSIQNIEEIPEEVREIYKTAFEVKQRDIVTQSIERGRFLDQAESLNLFMKEPDFNKLSSSHFFGWKHGIKTGMYYLRTQPASSAIQFGIDSTILKTIKDKRIQAGIESYKECPMVKGEDGRYQICESCQ
jgi:ribonucleoside-diphosphate reductase alpha subunit